MGLAPGLEVAFVDHGVPNRNLLPPTAIGILWTVPGFETDGYLSRGPYCRIKIHNSYRIQMVHPNEITLLGLATNDLEAMTIWLDQEVR